MACRLLGAFDEIVCGKSSPVPGSVLRSEYDFYSSEELRCPSARPHAAPGLSFARRPPGSPAWAATWKVLSKEHREEPGLRDLLTCGLDWQVERFRVRSQFRVLMRSLPFIAGK